MASETDLASSVPPPKFSRYRSVRQAASTNPAGSMSQTSQNTGVSRSMSRYRRSRPVAPPEHVNQTLPPTPTMPPPYGQPAISNPQRRVTAPIEGRAPRPQIERNLTEERHRESGSERRRRQAQEALAREEQAYRLRKEKEERDRIAKMQRAEQEAAQAHMSEEEAARILKENKRKDLERLEAALEAAAPTAGTRSPRDRFTFFSRKKAAAQSAPPPASRIGAGPPLLRTRSNDTPALGIEQGGGGIVPGTDAPMSAVNGGDRRVLVRYKQSSINLPITPETTSKDLVYSAANTLNHNINPSTAVLLESYTDPGLERRIRRYEPIRDILNSWDRDTQNALILENSESPGHDQKTLEAHSVPKEPPGDVRVFMYHSQKPGRWTKRHITLLSTGQIYVSKKPGAKLSDKDVTSLCHLSDFDIYTPTHREMRKNLRPPRKQCYAIRSQQKSTMFLNTENYVHFFCTNDEALADEWYSAVQSWRSWYLVHKKGEGRRKISKPEAPDIRIRPSTNAGPTHARRPSADENPYTIGSFTPLISSDPFDTPANPPPEYEEYDSDDENRPRQIPFHLRNMSPNTRQESRRHPPQVSRHLPTAGTSSDGEFAATGLLGRTYTQRQKAQKEREQASGPFVEGLSPVNAQLPTTAYHRTNSMRTNTMRTNTMRSRPGTSGGPSASGIQRSMSKREKPAPLLDFTPTFVEPPQWNKAGKGHGVAAPLGVPLVEAATTPETALDDIPKSTVFRREEPLARRPSTARPATSGGRTGGRDAAFVKGGLVEKVP